MNTAAQRPPTPLDRWVPYRRPRTTAPALRLFCFPYAGGLASAFNGWTDALPASIEVCSVQYPGRAGRTSEPMCKRIESLVDALAPALSPLLGTPYAFFGHSMGGLVAFELTRRVRALKVAPPVHLFISGTRAPHIPDPRGPRHTLPEAELIEELRSYGGTPQDVLEHEELMQIVLPLIRADFEMNFTYTFASPEAVDVPISTFGGRHDSAVPPDTVEAWRDYTRAAFRWRLFEGDHFFINPNRRELLLEVTRDLVRYV